MIDGSSPRSSFQILNLENQFIINYILFDIFEIFLFLGLIGKYVFLFYNAHINVIRSMQLWYFFMENWNIERMEHLFPKWIGISGVTLTAKNVIFYFFFLKLFKNLYKIKIVFFQRNLFWLEPNIHFCRYITLAFNKISYMDII